MANSNPGPPKAGSYPAPGTSTDELDEDLQEPTVMRQAVPDFSARPGQGAVGTQDPRLQGSSGQWGVQPPQQAAYPQGPHYSQQGGQPGQGTYPPQQAYPSASGADPSYYGSQQAYPGQGQYPGQSYPGYPSSAQYPRTPTPAPQPPGGDRPAYTTGQVAGSSRAGGSMGRMNLPEPGEVIAGRYEVIDELGIGGMGAVYKAHQRGLNKEVAVKVLLPSASAIEGAAARFRREAMLAKELSHPNTIQLYDYGQTDDGLTYIVMELLDGHELEEEIQEKGPMAPERVKRITSQTLKSLAEAHAHGIVHRDLKPSNIMLVDVFGEEDFVKVLDFGIARAFADHQEDFKTRTGTIIGTPQYMAPEQLRGEDVGPPTDLYAMGLIMAEMLTGHPVFHSENTNLIIVAQLSPGDPPIGEEILRGPLGKVIFQATTKSLSRRYKTAIEMLNALERAEAATTGDIAAFREEVQRSEGPRRPPSEKVAPRGRDTEVTAKKRSALPIVLAILLLVGAGIGAAVFFMGRSGGDGTTQENDAVATSGQLGVATPQPSANPAQLAATESGRWLAQEIWRSANRVCMRASDSSTATTGQVRLMLMTTQPGARVYRGDTYLGRTPFNGEVPAGGAAEPLTIRLDGYRDENITVDLRQAAMPDPVTLTPITRERTRERDRVAREREDEPPQTTRTTRDSSTSPTTPATSATGQQRSTPSTAEPTQGRSERSIGAIDDEETPSTRTEQPRQPATRAAEPEPEEDEPEPATPATQAPTPATQERETQPNIPILY